ncbi:MAG: hypothetical protein V4474_02580 [Patescibacteria group bacterium]
MSYRQYYLSFKPDPTALIVGVWSGKAYREIQFPLSVHNREITCKVIHKILSSLKQTERPAVVDERRQQLMRLATWPPHAELPHVAPIGGAFLPPLREWLDRRHTQGWRRFQEIEIVMFTARNAITEFPQTIQEGPNPRGPVSAWFRSDGTLSIDNGRASLANETDGSISNHNLDGATNQITLLCGLAALHDIADKNLYPPPV